MMRNNISLLLIAVLTVISCNRQDDSYFKIEPEVLKDKIAGGWAGKMIGVTYGAPTEFRAKGKTYEDSIKWVPSDIRGSIWQDDLYVQLTFLMAMDQYGIDAPAKKYHEMLAKAGYPLWHANVQARKNYYDSIFPPLSGHPQYNFHADDIDFQIEADYIGFMCPGMPQTVIDLCDKAGRIMNYGDGLYGGIFVSALYAEAFFDNDISSVIQKALKAIPSESDYAAIVRDVVTLHNHYPDDWRAAWNELEAKWGDVDICGAGDAFNIDAKLNGAYIVMGLLFGNGDPVKTLEISTRCGQDSDCNPSNALAVLGVIKGFSGLPSEMQQGINSVADSVFINTNYTFNKAVESSYNYALKFISTGGGSSGEKQIKIKRQTPVAPVPEVSFPDVVFDHRIPAFDKSAWDFQGNWQVFQQGTGDDGNPVNQSVYAEKSGTMAELKFKGTGITLMGNWVKDGGKADIFLDGESKGSFDTYFNYGNQEHHNINLWHVFGLSDGEHTLKVVARGDKRPESAGTRIYITEALVFKTEPKKNSDFKFSFE